jgi:hypothetical protein
VLALFLVLGVVSAARKRRAAKRVAVGQGGAAPEADPG